MSWFLRGLRRGVVTTRYPATPLDCWASALRSPPAFRSAGLTPGLADELVAICPSRALVRDGQTLVYDVGACTACGRCLEAGRGAVAPSREFELAATRRDQLVKRIPLRGGSL